MVEPVETPSPLYVRFRAATPNARGTYPGVFALANHLAASGRLSETDAAWWRTSNDWGNAAYDDPSERDPAVFDRDVNPGAASWFKASATELVDYARGYAALLARYGVDVAESVSDDPGVIIYEDTVQVVAVPRTPPR